MIIFLHSVIIVLLIKDKTFDSENNCYENVT